MALNCRADRRLSRQLLGVKRTFQFDFAAAANDPSATLAVHCGNCFAIVGTDGIGDHRSGA